MANESIRVAARENGVKLWQLAERLGINDGTLSRHMRRQFKPAAERRALRIIAQIKQETDAGHSIPTSHDRIG